MVSIYHEIQHFHLLKESCSRSHKTLERLVHYIRDF